MNKLAKILGITGLVLALNGCSVYFPDYTAKKISVNKVLEMDVETYVKSKGKSISDYELIGVGRCSYANCEGLVYCCTKIPQKTEVLITPALDNKFFTPVALVPKNDF